MNFEDIEELDDDELHFWDVFNENQFNTILQQTPSLRARSQYPATVLGVYLRILCKIYFLSLFFCSVIRITRITVTTSGHQSYHLIGDSGYALRPNPYLAWNRRHSRIPVLHYQPSKATKIINACCVLHNMCIVNNMDYPDIPLNEDLGILDAELPVVRGNETRRSNILLIQAREKERLIINNYFN
ncbi:hypothetical protein ACJJTC_006478 [Scirpophaga incertulas]